MLVRGASPATRGLVGLIAALAAGAVLLTGCNGSNGSPVASGTSDPSQGSGGSSSDNGDGGNGDPGDNGGQEPSQTPTPKPSPKAKIAITPATGASEVKLDTPVTVKVTDGKLTKVSVKNAKGETLAGKLDATQSSWTSTDGLSEEATYQVAATAVDADGLATSASNSFQTLDISKSDVLETNIEPDGQTVGIAMPIVIKFSDGVEKANRAAVVKKLSVVTNKPVTGAWRWFSSKEVHWRPKSYWPAGTAVTVNASLKGVPSGDGEWGVKNKVKKFTIGRSVIHKVNLNDHHLRSYVNGKLVKTIPVSGGKAGWRTRVGTKVILERRTNLHFTDEQIDADDNYDLTSAYGVRVTWSGEFLHSADWSRANHGRRNGSHGCVGMSTKNSKWVWQNSLVGDPVEVVGGGGSQMPVWGNGLGDWNMSWASWIKPQK